MKKCSSCTKDLPDSALHCVFCGAKQAPAPVPGSAAQQAKTVLGYQAADVMKDMAARARGTGSQPPPMAGFAPTQAAPMGSAPTLAASPGAMSRPQPIAQPMGPPMGPPPISQPPPPSPSQAPTMFIPGGGGPPQGGYNAPAPAGYPPPPAPAGYPPAPPPPSYAPQPMAQHGSAPVPMAQYHQPSGPAAVPPYLASQSAARAVRPIEPYSDGLKLVMLSFGILLLGAFATPIGTNPMVFHWNTIVDAPGVVKLTSLMLVASGLLALVIALLPLAAVGRGAIAAAIGVFIVATPYIQAGALDHWQTLVTALGGLSIVAGLLLRQEYREASLGRIVTTVGAVLILATYLIPAGGTVPLVGFFQLLIDVPGAQAKVGALLLLVPAVLAIVSLLVWMPAPSSAGAKAIAWIWIVMPAAFGLIAVAITGDFGGAVKQSPFGALMAWVPASAAAALVGYGVATVLGKQLE